MKNILSIDFDKFLTKEIMPLSEIKGHTGNYHGWIRRIAENRDYLSVGVKEQEIIDIISLILDQDIDMVSVANSHAKIVELLSEDTKYNIYNIDHHHDIFYGAKAGKEKWGCGNWVDHLKEKDKLGKYVWIRNSDSKLLEYNFRFEHEHTSNMNYIKNIKFDDIFICKSSTWVPLHLHREFYKMVGVIGIEKGLRTFDAEHVNPLFNPECNNKDFIMETIEMYNKIRG